MTEPAVMEEPIGTRRQHCRRGRRELSFRFPIPISRSAEIEAVDTAMRSPRLSAGPTVEAFEAAFAAYVGRKYAVAVPSGTLGLLIALQGLRDRPGTRSHRLALFVSGDGPRHQHRRRKAGIRRHRLLGRNTGSGKGGSPHYREHARHRRVQQ